MERVSHVPAPCDELVAQQRSRVALRIGWRDSLRRAELMLCDVAERQELLRWWPVEMAGIGDRGWWQVKRSGLRCLHVGTAGPDRRCLDLGTWCLDLGTWCLNVGTGA